MTDGDATRGRLHRFRWPLRILLALLVPALLLGGLELVLRLSGYGYDWHLFVPVKGTDLVASNPEFGHRFFPQAVAREPLLSSFPAEKSPGSYRIFVLGARCLAQGGDLDGAASHFRRALDLDALRFRSGTGINRVIRETAAANRSGEVFLVDTEKLIADLSRRNGTLPGQELFYEHVHFRFLGNYLVARAMLDAVEAGLPPATRAGVSQAEIPTPAECVRILAWTPFNQYRMLSDSRPWTPDPTICCCGSTTPSWWPNSGIRSRRTDSWTSCGPELRRDPCPKIS